MYERNISTCGEGRVLFEVRRPLSNELDRTMEPLEVGKPIQMIMGGLYNEFNTSYDLMPGHTRGKGFHSSLEIMILEDGRIVKTGSDPYYLHGIVLWGAWGLLGLLQIASNRYIKSKWHIAMLIHRITASIIWLSTIIMSLIVIKHEGWAIKESKHATLGFGLLISVTFPLIGGLIARYLKESARWATKRVL